MNEKFLSSRAKYGVGGWVAGSMAGLIPYLTWKHEWSLLYMPALTGIILALWWGERKGRIPSRDEAARPITLFPKDSPTNPPGPPSST